MLYYDRQLPPKLASLLLSGQPLSWLVELVRAEPSLRMEFRRADSERRWGSIQIYQGRTSPLELLGQATSLVKLAADPVYRKQSPKLFTGPLDPRGIELDLRRASGALAIAVQRNGQLVANFDSTTAFEADDIVFLQGPSASVRLRP